MRRWDQLTEKFRKTLEVRGLVASTIKGQIREMERWGLHLKRQRPWVKLEEVGREQIEPYLIKRCRFKAKSTRNSILSHVRRIGKFLVSEGIWLENPMRWIHGPRRNGRQKLPRTVSKSVLTKLMQAAASMQGEYQRRLWPCIVAILYGAGPRRGQLMGLKVRDWDRTQGLLRLGISKRGDEHIVAVPEVTGRCIEAYLPWRQNVLFENGAEHEELLISATGRPLKPNRVNKTLKRLAARAEVGHIWPHRLRHSCATHLLESGASISEVQRILGHAYVGSTMRYISVTDPMKHEAIKHHPISGMLDGHEE